MFLPTACSFDIHLCPYSTFSKNLQKPCFHHLKTRFRGMKTFVFRVFVFFLVVSSYIGPHNPRSSLGTKAQAIPKKTGPWDRQSPRLPRQALFVHADGAPSVDN